MKKLIPAIFILLIIGCNTSQSYKNNENEDTSGKNFNGFLFVGMKNYNPAVYKFNVNEEKYYPVWYNRSEKVVELSYSPDRKSVFFVTASSKGKRGVFPFIKNVKVYQMNPDSENAKFLIKLGTGMQLYTSWESDSEFKIILNAFDRVKANQINQHDVSFNTNGKKIKDEIKKFNIVKDGYPIPSIKEEKTIDEKYVIDSTQDDLTSIFLINKTSKDTIPITSVKQKLNKHAWADSGKYLIFTTKDLTPGNETLYDKDPSTSKLFIYSIEDKSIKKTFEGGGVKNFFIINNWVIFDDGFKDKSTIKIYNFIDLKLIKEIKIEGGCGLKNIPEIPDYSA